VFDKKIEKATRRGLNGSCFENEKLFIETGKEN